MKFIYGIMLVAGAISGSACAEESASRFLLHPTWSPDSTSIAYQRRSGEFASLRTVDLNSGGVATLTTLEHWDSYPSFDPAGKMVVFVRAKSGASGDWDLYLHDLESGKEWVLTDDPARDWHPQWSPDGESISFVRTVGEQTDIFRLDIASGRVDRITDTPNASEYHPKWRPDGKALVFDRSEDNSSRIVVLELGTGVERTFAEGAGDERLGTPSYSADGGALFFVRQRGEEDGLWTIDSTTGRARRLLSTGANESIGGPVESPDGTRIAFHFERDGSFDLCVANVSRSDISEIRCDFAE